MGLRSAPQPDCTPSLTMCQRVVGRGGLDWCTQDVPTEKAAQSMHLTKRYLGDLFQITGQYNITIFIYCTDYHEIIYFKNLSPPMAEKATLKECQCSIL